MSETLKIAAQVVIATPTVDARRITARNIRSLRPDAELAERVVNGFSALGFTAGPMVGNSFSIEAGPQVFHQAFGVSPRLDADGRVRDHTAQGVLATEPLSGLPVDRLPPTLRALVRTVVFSEPPAFGPGTMP